jgi:hypothetical protein
MKVSKKQKNLVQCSGVNMHENTTLHFNSQGIKMYVSLNIPKEIVPLFPEDQVFKGEMFLIKAEEQITNVNSEEVQKTHKGLLLFLMKYIREKKSLYYKLEAEKL